MEITYALIKPIIKEERVDSGTMYCTFKCDDSADNVQATASVYNSQSGAAKAMDVFKQEARYNISLWISQLFQRLLGFNFGISAGRIVQAGMQNNSADLTLFQADKEKAVVAAFKTVADKFEYANGNWKSIKN